jgi:hypothetical protein
MKSKIDQEHMKVVSSPWNRQCLNGLTESFAADH